MTKFLKNVSSHLWDGCLGEEHELISRSAAGNLAQLVGYLMLFNHGHQLVFTSKFFSFAVSLM